MDKDTTMTANPRECRRVQGMLVGRAFGWAGLCARGFRDQSRKMGRDQPLEGLKGRLKS